MCCGRGLIIKIFLPAIQVSITRSQNLYSYFTRVLEQFLSAPYQSRSYKKFTRIPLTTTPFTTIPFTTTPFTPHTHLPYPNYPPSTLQPPSTQFSSSPLLATPLLITSPPGDYVDYAPFRALDILLVLPLLRGSGESEKSIKIRKGREREKKEGLPIESQLQIK